MEGEKVDGGDAREDILKYQSYIRKQAGQLQAIRQELKKEKISKDKPQPNKLQPELKASREQSLKLANDLKANKETLTKQEKHNLYLQEQLAKKQADLKSHKDTLTKLESQLKLSKSEANRYHATIQKLQCQLHIVKEERARFQTEAKELRREIKEVAKKDKADLTLSQRLSKKDERHKKQEEIDNSYQKLREQLNKYQSEAKKLQQELVAKQQIIKELKDCNVKVESELKGQCLERQRVNQDLKRVKQNYRIAKDSKEVKQKVSDDHILLQSQLKKMTIDQTKNLTTIKNLQYQLNMARSQLQRKDRAILQSKQEIKVLNENIKLAKQAERKAENLYRGRLKESERLKDQFVNRPKTRTDTREAVKEEKEQRKEEFVDRKMLARSIQQKEKKLREAINLQERAMKELQDVKYELSECKNQNKKLSKQLQLKTKQLHRILTNHKQEHRPSTMSSKKRPVKQQENDCVSQDKLQSFEEFLHNM